MGQYNIYRDDQPRNQNQSKWYSKTFAFEGLPGTPLPQTWLDPRTRSLNPAPVWLGPEPLIGAQSIALTTAAPQPSAQEAAPRLWVSTDGLRPFTVQTSPP